MTDFVHVSTDQLHKHAMHVDDSVARMSAPSTAATEVTPGGWDFAYGTYCQFLAIVISQVADAAVQANNITKQSLDATAQRLHDSAGEYAQSEHANKLHMETVANQEHAAAESARHAKLLVDKDAKFDPGTYGTDADEINRGDYSSLNPFVTGAGDSWVAGLGFLDDATEVRKAMARGADHSDAVAVVMAATVATDVFGLLDDPVGTLGSWAGGWVLEHVKPIRLMLDGLGGNPDMVKGVAVTWQNIAKDLHEIAAAYKDDVSTDTGKWHGAAADAYRDQSAHKLFDAIAGMSELAHGISILVNAAGEIVDATRGVLRDILAMAIGELVRAGVKMLGFSVPTEVLGQLAEQTRLAAKTVTTLIKVLEEFGPLLSTCLTLYGGIAKILPHGD